MDEPAVPDAMISLWLHELGMQVFVAAGPGEDDRVMNVSFDDPTGPSSMRPESVGRRMVRWSRR
jgi:hypothetical protein